jgi:hypothetical protein
MQPHTWRHGRILDTGLLQIYYAQQLLPGWMSTQKQTSFEVNQTTYVD